MASSTSWSEARRVCSARRIEFSHDLDILISPVQANLFKLRAAIRDVTTLDPAEELLLNRDFHHYVHPDTGEELDVHLKLIAIPDYATALANSSDVDFLGRSVRYLELPALDASKRTDRPRDAIHRRAIEERLAALVLTKTIDADEVIVALCLDERARARLVRAKGCQGHGLRRFRRRDEAAEIG